MSGERNESRSAPTGAGRPEGEQSAGERPAGNRLAGERLAGDCLAEDAAALRGSRLARPRVVVAGAGSGVGKTTVAIGLMRALARAGRRVQGFKCGPDYIDPTYHAAVTGRPSRNLDTWMLTPDTMKDVFLRGSEGADVSVVEGVMGLYDGRDPLSDDGSTADVAAKLDAPVLLVVDVAGAARSAAAVVLGFARFNERVRIAGVIANRCGGRGHYELVKAAVEATCGVPVVGWLASDETLAAPERHLGLVPAVERGELTPLFERIADRIAGGVDLDAVLAIAAAAPPLERPAASLLPPPAAAEARREDGPTIAVARDGAFHFYYPENLETLERLGAKLVYFSPVAGETVPPEADGLYMGGGFPEQFLPALAANERLKRDVRELAARGMPVLAECGGYMYLCRSIATVAGETYPMAGVVPARCAMTPRLAALGYREVAVTANGGALPPGATLRGHEFHYSVVEPDEPERFPAAYIARGLRGEREEGYATANVTAGYTHLHFGSNPDAANHYLKACTIYRKSRRL